MCLVTAKVLGARALGSPPSCDIEVACGHFGRSVSCTGRGAALLSHACLVKGSITEARTCIPAAVWKRRIIDKTIRHVSFEESPVSECLSEQFWQNAHPEETFWRSTRQDAAFAGSGSISAADGHAASILCAGAPKSVARAVGALGLLQAWFVLLGLESRI